MPADGRLHNQVCWLSKNGDKKLVFVISHNLTGDYGRISNWVNFVYINEKTGKIDKSIHGDYDFGQFKIAKEWEVETRVKKISGSKKAK